MNIVWFSEVKWNYLTHRHHQLIRRFPADWNILFIENFVLGRPNHFWPRRDGRVTYVTIPTFKPTNRVIIDRVQGFAAFRWLISGLIVLWTSLLIKCTGFSKPGAVLVTSNIFFADVIKRLRGPKIYDCNDYPMGFPRALPFTEPYFAATIRAVDLVVTVTEKLKEDVTAYRPKAVNVIGNGVDSTLFTSHCGSIPEEIRGLQSPIVLYVGVLSDWFDFDLLTSAAKRHPGVQFVNVGPVISPAIQERVDDAGRLPNVHFLGIRRHEDLPAYLEAAKLCWIPFHRNSLIERFSPNKLYEYAAAGRQVVTMDYTVEIKRLAGTILVGSSPEELQRMLDLGLQTAADEDKLRSLAAANDWVHKTNAMVRCIEEIVGGNHANV